MRTPEGSITVRQRKYKRNMVYYTMKKIGQGCQIEKQPGAGRKYREAFLILESQKRISVDLLYHELLKTRGKGGTK